jgi:hypothetical protein
MRNSRNSLDRIRYLRYRFLEDNMIYRYVYEDAQDVRHSRWMFVDPKRQPNIPKDLLDEAATFASPPAVIHIEINSTGYKPKEDHPLLIAGIDESQTVRVGKVIRTPITLKQKDGLSYVSYTSAPYEIIYAEA